MSYFYFYSFFFTQTPFYLPRPAVTGFYRVFYRDFTEFLPSFYRVVPASLSTCLVFHCVVAEFFIFDLIFKFFFQRILVLTGFYRVLPGFTEFSPGFDEVLPAFTEFYLVCPTFTAFYLVFPTFTEDY